MTQQVIPQMKKQGSGHVLSISATLADQPSASLPALTAVLSKSTLPAASKALALEYAAHHIRFNTISPGVINTPMHAGRITRVLAKFHPLNADGRRDLGYRRRGALSQGATFVTSGEYPPGWRGARQTAPDVTRQTSGSSFTRA